MDRFHVGHGTEVGPLTVFPVWSEAPIDDAVRVMPQSPQVAVEELEVPTVPMLTVTNGLASPVLLTEGTLLHGGRQTRVLERDVLLSPRSRTDVSVSCVEQGRWHGGRRHDIAGRVPMTIIAALRDTGGANGDSTRRSERQARVWQDVQRFSNRYGRSETASLRELMDGDSRVERDDEQALRDARRRKLVARLQMFASNPLPGQSGIMVGALGQPISLEIITSPREFAKNMDALLTAIAVDVADLPNIPTPSRRALRFAEHAMDAPLELTWEDKHGLSFGVRTDRMSIHSLNGREESSMLHSLMLSTRHDLILAA
jgi:hypothetical protein